MNTDLKKMNIQKFKNVLDVLSQLSGSLSGTLAEKRDRKETDPDRLATKSYTALIAAVKARRPKERIEELIAEHAGEGGYLDHRDYRSRSAIWIATGTRQMDTALALHAAGASLYNSAWPDGQSVMHMLCVAGYYEVVFAILNRIVASGKSRAEAIVELRRLNRLGDDALAAAIQNEENYEAILQEAVAWGYPVNATFKEGWTLLHYAARKGSVGAILVLLGLGAEVDRAKQDGLTALHLTVMNGNIYAARCLIRHGADPTLCAAGLKGRSPLTYAEQKAKKHPEFALRRDMLRVIRWAADQRNEQAESSVRWTLPSSGPSCRMNTLASDGKHDAESAC